MTVVDFIVLWLAGYRITRFVTDDVLIDTQRQWFYQRFPPNSEYARYRRAITAEGVEYWAIDPAPSRKVSRIGLLFDCAWCLGVWVSAALIAVVSYVSSIPLPVLWWLAVSSAIGLTARNLDGS